MSKRRAEDQRFCFSVEVIRKCVGISKKVLAKCKEFSKLNCLMSS